jgi:hypothetical protein
VEKGEAAYAARARALAEAIRVVKQDQVSPALQAEFFAGSAVPLSNPTLPKRVECIPDAQVDP